MTNTAVQQVQPTTYQQAEQAAAQGVRDALVRVQQVIDFAQRDAIQKKEKEKKAEIDAKEEAGGIRFGLAHHQLGQNRGSSSAPKKTYEEIEAEAAEDIEKQIEAHKANVTEQAGVGYLDAGKPVVMGNTADNAQIMGRIIAANEVFIAVSHGRNIEIHRVENMKLNMMYVGGKDSNSKKLLDVCVPGNMLELKYKDGKATTANVIEQRQEKQQEKVLGKGFSR